MPVVVVVVVVVSMVAVVVEELTRNVCVQGEPTLDVFAVPCITIGRKMLTINMIKTTPEKVTRESSQFHVKETMMAATIKDVNSTKTPSFSEMPSWRTLLVAVMVDTAWPGGMESNTWMLWLNSLFR